MGGISHSRREFLKGIGFAGFIGGMASACGNPHTSPRSSSARFQPTPHGGSPRSRLRTRSTVDHTAMYIYNMGGVVGQEYSKKQIETVAKVYDLLTWVYAKSGIPEIAHRSNPNVIVTQYFDLTWVGSYDQAPNQPWMPVPWKYVDDHESFFSHSSTVASRSTRIANPIFGYGSNSRPTMKQDDPNSLPHEWLANPFDFDPANPESMSHWINYFANSAVELIEGAHMDGIMMDEVELPYGTTFPYGYSSQSWYAQLDKCLAFIRQRLGQDRVMLANGVFGDSIPTLLNPSDGYPRGATWPSNDMNFLTWCDGLQMELFVTSYAGPNVWPQLFWEGVCQVCMDIAAQGGVTLAQAPILAEDSRVRMFVLASFHLVKGARSYLSHRGGGSFPWFPEWTVSLGAPIETKSDIEDYLLPSTGKGQIAHSEGIAYAREFSKGIALANPSSSPSSVSLRNRGYQLIPRGGGWIGTDGALPKGALEYGPVSTIELDPQSGALILMSP